MRVNAGTMREDQLCETLGGSRWRGIRFAAHGGEADLAELASAGRGLAAEPPATPRAGSGEEPL
jgi:hypothetical protein